MDQTERKALGDVFDRTIQSMNGLPDVLITKATTVRSLSSVLELSQTFIVQTYRQRDEGDTIFIEYIGMGRKPAPDVTVRRVGGDCPKARGTHRQISQEGRKDERAGPQGAGD